MTQYEHVINAFFSEPWALLRSKYDAIRGVLAVRAAGGHISADEIALIAGGSLQARHEAAGRVPHRSTDGLIAVIPLLGVIAPRASMMTESSGGTSVQAFTAALRQAVNNPDVGSIVIDVDSPGGQVGGIDELATELRAALAIKPIEAVANGMAASAAYWIASQVPLTVTPSGEVGSIGVIAEHWDESRAIDTAGLVPTVLSAGKYKTEGSPYGPLSDEALAHFQSRIDSYYSMFVAAVAKGRGVSVADARGERFGEGRMYGAKEAVRRGMADRVGTLDGTIARMARGGGRMAVTAAMRGDAAFMASLAETGVDTEPIEDVFLPVAFEQEPAPSHDLELAAARLRLA